MSVWKALSLGDRVLISAMLLLVLIIGMLITDVVSQMQRLSP